MFPKGGGKIALLPEAVIGRPFFPALISVACYQLLQPHLWLAASVATATAVIHATRTQHPPGGATALIALIGDQKIHAHGYRYALVPALSGAVIMLVVALLVNNIPRHRRYTEFWL